MISVLSRQTRTSATPIFYSSLRANKWKGVEKNPCFGKQFLPPGRKVLDNKFGTGSLDFYSVEYFLPSLDLFIGLPCRPDPQIPETATASQQGTAANTGSVDETWLPSIPASSFRQPQTAARKSSINFPRLSTPLLQIIVRKQFSPVPHFARRVQT